MMVPGTYKPIGVVFALNHGSKHGQKKRSLFLPLSNLVMIHTVRRVVARGVARASREGVVNLMRLKALRLKQHVAVCVHRHHVVREGVRATVIGMLRLP
jgi:hypothetical protein